MAGSSAETRVAGYTMALLGTTVGALALTPHAATRPELPWSVTPAVVALIVGMWLLNEFHTVVWEHDGHTQSQSLDIVPLTFAMVLLPPVQAVAVAGGGTALGYVASALVHRRFSILKLLWNSAMWAATAAVLAVPLRHVLGSHEPRGWPAWLAVLAAVLAAEALSTLAVALVIACHQGRLTMEPLRRPGRSYVITTVAACFAVTTLAASLVEPLLVAFAAVPLAGVASLLSIHGSLSRAHRDLQDLHHFTTALEADDDDQILGRLLTAVKASGVALVERGHRGVAVRTVDSNGIIADASPGLFSALWLESTGELAGRVTAASHPHLVRLLRHLDATELLVVPLCDADELIGVLVAYGRTGYRADFTEDEAALFNSLGRAFASRVVNQRLSRRDHLTGLPNREAFLDALDRAVASTGTGAVIQLDLVRFREINESLGHAIGDKVLGQVAVRLLAAVRATDLVSRLGSDEFSVLLDGDIQPETLARRVEDLRQHLRGPIVVEDLSFDIGVTVGASRWPIDGTHGTQLLARAEIALARAKHSDAAFVAFDESFDVATPRRLALAGDLRAALEDGAIDIHLQPKVDLATGHVVGAEALARWTHPELGPVPPGEFIPLVEQSGLVGRLTRLVLARAADTAADLNRLGLPIPIAVNLTPRDLLDPSLGGVVDDLLTARDLPGPLLEVEITEGAMVVDFETSLATLQQLRRRGLTVAVDDFGTGYSSLTYLHRLPVDCLKIDRSFISSLAHDATAAAIVRSSIRLAHDLGMTVVAEGIEDLTTLGMLTARGCDQAQGYLLARPMPDHAFLHWMIDHHSNALPQPPRQTSELG